MDVPIVTTGSAFSRGILLVATMDLSAWNVDPFDPSCHIRYWVEGRATPWSDSPVSANIVSAARYRYPDRDRQIQVVLTPEGDVGFFGKEEGYYERIPGAGLHADDAVGLGLHVFHPADRRLPLGLRAERADLQEGGEGHMGACGRGRVLEASAAGRDGIFADVNGPHEQSVYIVGQRGAVYWRDKEPFRQVAAPTSAWLNNILVQDEGTLWICGDGGTLLRGNHRDGFTAVAAGDTRESFLSMAIFQERLHLASASGLWVLDGDRIEKVRTSLCPELSNGHVLDALDGTLWFIGYRDIARFDGHRWERLLLTASTPQG
jgi:hypothetical protein